MSDQKIKVSWDDIDKQHDPAPQSSWSMPPISEPHKSPLASASYTKNILIGLAIFFVIFIAIFGLASHNEKRVKESTTQNVAEYTIEDYRNEILAPKIKDINETLQNPEHKLRKRIEAAHVSVTVKSAKITKYTINTLDQSQRAGGKAGTNIESIYLEINFTWDGWVHSNGYTKIACTCDKNDFTLSEAKIVDTNAMVNKEDPKFWENIGAATIGLMLL